MFTEQTEMREERLLLKISNAKAMQEEDSKKVVQLEEKCSKTEEQLRTVSQSLHSLQMKHDSEEVSLSVCDRVCVKKCMLHVCACNGSSVSKRLKVLFNCF